MIFGIRETRIQIPLVQCVQLDRLWKIYCIKDVRCPGDERTLLGRVLRGFGVARRVWLVKVSCSPVLFSLPVPRGGRRVSWDKDQK